MEQGLKNVATRMDAAWDDFAAVIQQIAGCSKADALKVTALYLKLKVAKMDAVNGRIAVKHGAFLDAATVANALTQIS